MLTDGDRDILAEQERDARPGPITARAVFDALDELGGTADIVAARLLAEGCKGHRDTCYMCPVVKYLTRRFEASAGVYGNGIAVGNVMIWDPPPAVAKFVERFDDGEFPDLES